MRLLDRVSALEIKLGDLTRPLISWDAELDKLNIEALNAIAVNLMMALPSPTDVRQAGIINRASVNGLESLTDDEWDELMAFIGDY